MERGMGKKKRKKTVEGEGARGRKAPAGGRSIFRSKCNIQFLKKKLAVPMAFIYFTYNSGAVEKKRTLQSSELLL